MSGWLGINRHEGESFFIDCPDGEVIEVMVTRHQNPAKGIRIGIRAPREYGIRRDDMKKNPLDAEAG
jgi:sRNA-binding carbon storage regulator CsrA